MAMLCYALGTRVAAVRSRGVSLSSLSDIHPNIFSSGAVERARGLQEPSLSSKGASDVVVRSVPGVGGNRLPSIPEKTISQAPLGLVEGRSRVRVT